MKKLRECLAAVVGGIFVGCMIVAACAVAVAVVAGFILTMPFSLIILLLVIIAFK